MNVEDIIMMQESFKVKRQFFSCHVFAMKNVQNLKSFIWRSGRVPLKITLFKLYFVVYTFSNLSECICRLRNIK